MQRFRTYDLAVAFYRNSKAASLPYYLKNQLLRAAASVALNIREGAAQKSIAMRRKHYRIAFASIKECQGVCDLETIIKLERQADVLAAHIFQLIRSLES